MRILVAALALSFLSAPALACKGEDMRQAKEKKNPDKTKAADNEKAPQKNKA